MRAGRDVPTKGNPNHPFRAPQAVWDAFGKLAKERGEVRGTLLRQYVERYMETGGEPYTIVKKVIRRRKKK